MREFKVGDTIRWGGLNDMPLIETSVRLIDGSGGVQFRDKFLTSVYWQIETINRLINEGVIEYIPVREPEVIKFDVELNDIANSRSPDKSWIVERDGSEWRDYIGRKFHVTLKEVI